MLEEYFDTALKCYAFKAITERLQAENLITAAEAAKIKKKISVMESALVKAQANATHSRIKEAA